MAIKGSEVSKYVSLDSGKAVGKVFHSKAAQAKAQLM